MKLMVIIPIWKRVNITKCVLNWYKRFNSVNIDYQIVVIGSEGEHSKLLAKNCFYVEAPNYPLDAKYDAGFNFCKSFNPDAVALVGSDDFITQDYFDWAASQISRKIDLVGLLDFFIADIIENKIYYWGGYDKERAGDAIGAGRVFSKKILNLLEWKPFLTQGKYFHFLYDDERSENNIKKLTNNIKKINMANIGCRYWAVKTGDEINSTKDFFENYNNLVNVTKFTHNLFKEDLKEIKPRSTYIPYL